MQILNDKWDSLATALHLQRGTVQHDEMQKAFYAGAMVVMAALNAAGKEDVSAEVGARVLESIDMEISIWNAFIQAKADAIRRQIAGRAKRSETN